MPLGWGRWRIDWGVGGQQSPAPVQTSIASTSTGCTPQTRSGSPFGAPSYASRCLPYWLGCVGGPERHYYFASPAPLYCEMLTESNSPCGIAQWSPPSGLSWQVPVALTRAPPALSRLDLHRSNSSHTIHHPRTHMLGYHYGRGH